MDEAGNPSEASEEIPLITDGTIETPLISDGTIETPLISDGTIETHLISDGAIETTIETPLISDGTIETPLISDGTIETHLISDRTIETHLISDGTIETPLISDGTIEIPLNSDGTIETPLISDGTITSTIQAVPFKRPIDIVVLSTQTLPANDNSVLQAKIENCKETANDKSTSGNLNALKADQRYFKIINPNFNRVQHVTVNKRQKVNLFTGSIGPQLYEVAPPQCTLPIQPSKLREAVSGVPMVGYVASDEELKSEQRRKIREFVGGQLTDIQFERLEMYCSPENLLQGTEMKIPYDEDGFLFDKVDINAHSNSSAAVGIAEQLSTIKKFKLRTEIDAYNYYARKLKYRGLRYQPVVIDRTLPLLSPEGPLIPGKDMLFRVRLNRPFDYNPKINAVTSSAPLTARCPIFSKDITFHGRQKLSELRDHVYCVNELSLRVDVSNNPKDKPYVDGKTLFPSGFFFINNVFYNDCRLNCKDLSASIREWARKERLGDFPTMDMDIRFDQMVLQLGHPEVYLHQGDCEHTFTFSDMRVLTATDPLNPAQYPIQTLYSKNQLSYCTTCADKLASWLVTNTNKLPFDPAFLCEKCLDTYLYDGEGKKIGDFKAYALQSGEIRHA